MGIGTRVLEGAGPILCYGCGYGPMVALVQRGKIHEGWSWFKAFESRCVYLER